MAKTLRTCHTSGFTSSCLIQPIMLNENVKDADLEAVIGNDDRSKQFKRLILQSPRVQKNLRNLIPLYDRLGVFD